MLIQTVTPTQRTVTVEVPDAYINRQVEVILLPREIAIDVETRREQIHEFFSQFNADSRLLKYRREDLYER